MPIGGVTFAGVRGVLGVNPRRTAGEIKLGVVPADELPQLEDGRA